MSADFVAEPGKLAVAREDGSDDVGPPRCEPVKWYAPRQLVRTAIEVLATKLFGQRADYRRLASLTQVDGVPLALPPCPGGARWIDFAADVGDGFSATFSVARALASDVTVEVSGEPRTLGGADVVLLGGDQVYPTPSRNTYARRFVEPFARAVPRDAAPKQRLLFAVPGNHDWYDGLVGFSKLFCAGESIGSFQTGQTRSYFALSLSEALWVFALDLQVEQDIDVVQLAYFRQMVATRLAKPGAVRPKIMLITAEPHWESTTERVDICALGKQHLLGTLLRELEAAGLEVVLQLTGDLHHYRRYTSQTGRHLITAGGGGAFLHPTHTGAAAGPTCTLRTQAGVDLTHRYALRAQFPSPARSRWLAFGNLGFALRNPAFSLLLGFVYLLLAIVLPPAEPGGLGAMIGRALENAIMHPGDGAILLLVFGMFWGFTETTRQWYRWVGGAAHATTHLVAALFVSDCARAFGGWYAALLDRFDPSPLIVQVMTMLSSVLLGGLVGGTLWGLYLLVSVNVFRRHSTEAFSSLRIEDYKCFVRMRLEERTLTLYPLGLRRTPRRWRWDPSRATWDPASPPEWELIEAPIVVAL